MRKKILVFIAVLLAVSGFAQRTVDIGVWGGASTYWGDMKIIDISQAVNPINGGIVRYNVNSRVGFRGMYLTGKMSAVGFMENVDWSFGVDPSKRIHDFSLMAEINYLKYIQGAENTPISPYILGGIGVMFYPYALDPAAIYRFNPKHNKGDFKVDESVMSLMIPFGMGVKTHFGKRIGMGVEVLFRKLLDDKLDNLDDPLAFSNTDKDITYTDFMHNNDYTAYLGIHLTYKIFIEREVCPAFESIN